jgi:hypothetical protein
MSEIFSNLYISDKQHVPIFKSDYDLIVNCTPDIPFPIFCNLTIRIPVHDHPSYAKKMYSLIKQTYVLESIHKHLRAGKTVLVHCRAGVQRSCAVVACYLVKYCGMTVDHAISLIRHKRPIAFYAPFRIEDAKSNRSNPFISTPAFINKSMGRLNEKWCKSVNFMETIQNVHINK